MYNKLKGFKLYLTMITLLLTAASNTIIMKLQDGTDA